MAVTNCHLAKTLSDRILQYKFGLMCNTKPDNTLFLESYIHVLECRVIDMTCVDTKPCDLTVCVLADCNLLTTQLMQVVNPNNGSLFGFSIDLNLIQNADEPFTGVVWEYDENYWDLDESLIDSLTLFATANQVTDTEVSITLTDSNGCRITISTTVSYKVGCTNPLALNYDPLATIDNGQCFLTPLTANVGYVCDEDGNGTMVVVVTGGVPPYTPTGNGNNTTVINGEDYFVFITDSIGNTTPVYTGTIVCPFDCDSINPLINLSYDCLEDGNGDYTGLATLNLSVSGGTPPYTLTGGTNGQIVSHGQLITINGTDVNGCVLPETNITIDCPTEIVIDPPLECEEIFPIYNSALIARKRITFSQLTTRLTFNVTNLPLGITVQSIQHTFNDCTGAAVTFTNPYTTLSSSGQVDFTLNFNPDPAPTTGCLEVDVTITLSNGCMYSHFYILSGTQGVVANNTVLDTEIHNF